MARPSVTATTSPPSAVAARLSTLRPALTVATLLSVAAGALAWLACLPVLRAVLTDNDRGLDLMDESHYLMAAQPWAADKAYNGIWGWYGGPVLRLLGGDLARYRLVGDWVLIAAALVLATAARRAATALAGSPWPGWLRAVWPPAVVSVALCYYTVFVRTPSYNWFAAVGLMLLAAGLLRAVADPPSTRWQVLGAGALLSVGAFVTAIGKATTAAGASAVVLVVLAVHGLTATRSARVALVRVVGAGAGCAVLVVLFHVAFVNGLGTTLATYRRISGMLAAVDPWHYAPSALRDSVAAGWRDVALDRPADYRRLLLLPVVVAVVPWFGARRRGWWLAAAFVAVAAIPLYAIIQTYPGGVPGLGMSVSPIVIATEAAVLVAAAVALWLRFGPVPAAGPVHARGREPVAGPSGRDVHRGEVQRRAGVRGAATALLLAAALAAMGLFYPVGTNVEYATQLHGGFVVLFVATAIGVCCVPDGGRLACLAALAAGGIALGALLVPGTRDQAPYRIALLDQQTLPRVIVPGTPPILVDPTTAQWVDDLRKDAALAGFAPGTPVLELTWHPATVLVLGGQAPKTLLPAFPGWPTPAESATYTLQQEDPAVWAGAWVVVIAGQQDQVADQALAVVGRHFPQDYERVGVVTAPYDGEQQELWRPRR